jgi:hypothetical protein
MDNSSTANQDNSKFINWSKLKQISAYKYVFAVILIASVFAIFNALGTDSTEATPSVQGENNVPTLNNGSDNSDSGARFEPAGSSDIEELERVIAQDPQVDSENIERELRTEPTSGRVLQATTTQNSAAYNQLDGFVRTTAEVLGDALIPPQPSVQGIYTDESGQQYVEYTYGGALPSLLGMVGTMYEEPPVTVEVWAQDIRNKINLNVTAQDSTDSDTYNPGQGFELLNPIRELWGTAVNTVYIIYILIVVFLSFLILFRSQLGGQEVITLYNSIPSLVISLVLVYFSYPISALAIDLVTISSGVVYGVLIGDGPDSGAPGDFLYSVDFTETRGSGTDLLDDVVNLITGGGQQVDPRTELQIDDPAVNVWRIFQTSGISPTGDDIEVIIPQDVPLADALSNIIEGATGTGGLANSLLKLVFIFAAFSASLKLFFSLLKSYVFLIILPVASPFIFLIAAIPSQTTSVIQEYFGRLLASALSFVAVYTVFLVIIIIARDTTAVDDILWTPPLLGYGAEQTIPGTNVATIARPLIAYALFVSTPLIPDYIFEVFGSNNDSPFAKNVAEATKGGARNVLGGIGGVSQFARRNVLGIPDQQQRQR